MRILQVSPSGQVAGGEKVILQLATGLVGRGHAVEVCVPAAGPFSEALAASGLPFHLLPVARTYDLGAAYRLGELVRKRGVEVLHTHGMLVNVPGRLAVLASPGVASVSTVHLTQGFHGPARVGGAFETLKARFYYRPLDNWTVRTNRAVVAVSRAVQEDLLAQGYPRGLVRVIPNGIDPDLVKTGPGTRETTRASLGLAPDAAALLVVARLSPQKDIPCFLQAMARVLKARPGAVGLVAGSGALEAELRAGAGALGLGSACRFLGQRDDIPALLAAADVFVLPSRWEGLPISVLEAMAAGKPVVATRVDGTAEAVVEGRTGRLVPPGDPAALAEALLATLADPEGAARMGREGRARILDSFSATATVAAHEDLYRCLLTRSPTPP